MQINFYNFIVIPAPPSAGHLRLLHCGKYSKGQLLELFDTVLSLLYLCNNAFVRNRITMKSKKVSLLLLIVLTLMSFEGNNKIEQCFISFDSPTKLTAAKIDRLPENSEKTRTINTQNGEVSISRIDGYRVLYNNYKEVPFVNLKVELSVPSAYENDRQHLLDNLKYLNVQSSGMETKEPIELKFNGYKIFGISRGSIESGSTLGTFIMFPGNGVTVYFYFNNLKPGFRTFENLEDYKKQRDLFLEEYTKHLKECGI